MQSNNSRLLILWKASTTTKEEALIIINKDVKKMQQLHTERLQDFVLSGLPLKDVSPEYPLEFVPEPYDYKLNPGQGLVYVTKRNGRVKK